MISNSNEKKFHILEIGTTDTKGGAAAVSWALKQELSAQGHTVNMIVGYKRSSDSHVREIWDAPINNFISKLIKRNLRARLQHHLAYWLSNDIALLPGRRILASHEFQNADIVHAHNLHSLFFNLKALPHLSNRKPFIWTLHDMWPLLGQGAHAFECNHWMTGGCDCNLPSSLPPFRRNNSRHLWKLKKHIYEQMRLNLVVPSLWLKSKVEKSILKDKPLHLIYNGVNTDIFKPGNKQLLRAKLNLPKDKEIVLFSAKGGKDNIWKGGNYIDALLEKYRNDNSILFLNIGTYTPRHSELASESRNKNIKSIPYIADQKLLAEYYAASGLLLYPSLADNCPLVILEALSSGLPVLAFSTGGIPELIEHKQQGYIAMYNDLPDLLYGFQWLMNLPHDQAQAMSRSCRNRALEKFTLEKMVNEYLKLYYAILH
ncbi:MAG: glycosyltransferase [Patescibacteria group bacterium]